MAGQLISLDNRPSALARNRRSSLNSNAKQGIQASFAVLGYKGKNWRLKVKSAETVLHDDRNQPLTSIEAVIVGISPAISRQYFGKSYSEGDNDGPDCYSTDGIKPDAGAPHKQNPVCATCPQGQWGSRITDAGKRAKNCQDTRRIAVVPLTDLEQNVFGPMLLRVPPMSLNNLSNYSDFLDRKGAGFECVGTRIGFDVSVAYPRLTFDAIGWLDEDQQRLVTGDDGNGGLCADPLIERMLGADLTQTEEVEPRQRRLNLGSDAPEPQRAPPQREPIPPQPEPDEPDDDDDSAVAVAAPPRATPFNAAAARKTPQRKPAAPTVPNDEDMESALDDLLGDTAA
jgi:hypothetical protein